MNKEPKKYNIAVVGATGNIGAKTLDMLVERNFPYANITAAASPRSVGAALRLSNGAEVKIRRIDDVDFENIDIAFFCAGSSVSSEYAAKAANMGCIVIDKTSFFRMEENIPLIVPEINIDSLSNSKTSPRGIISCPNCVAIPLSMALYALISGGLIINNVIVSTYQSVSGAGRQAVKVLRSQSLAILNGDNQEKISSTFPRKMAFNAIPQIGDITAPGAYADEEEKIMREVSKIIDCLSFNISVTCVRIPTFVGHGVSVYVELNKVVCLEELGRMFKRFPGMSFDSRRDYITPVEVTNCDEVFVGRLRQAGNGYLFWIVADNLRKGAALNGVQIAERLIKLDPDLYKFRQRKQT
ncbi:MAG: aspartate-semialdehyde dehydrogenase [Holosporales bacterium]|nr:aspartate-semialdehyde dehydrogenase [Holosporales bacterium]